MKSLLKFLWIAACIAIICGMGGQRALAYIDPPPSITSLTGNQTTCVTTTVQISVVAVNAASYQWRKNGVNLTDGGNISGSTSATLTINNITTSDAGDYSVVVSNPYGSATSDNSHLTVQTDPIVIVTQPVNQAVLLGASATQLAQFQSSDGVYVGGNTASFSVVATGCNPVSYQWRKNGINLSDGGNISGAHSANLQINSVSMADAGTYMVVISNALGTVSSANVSLHVCQLETTFREEVLTNQTRQVQGGPRVTMFFHFASPTTISGFTYASTVTQLFTGASGPATCQLYNSAIPDPTHQINLTPSTAGGGTKFYCTVPNPSTDYTVVFNFSFPWLPPWWNPLSKGTIVTVMQPPDNGNIVLGVSGDILVSLFQTVSTSDWDCQGPTPLPSVAFSPDSGQPPLDVTLSVPGYANSQIYYTVDGSAPTRSSPLYSSPIHLTTTTTVNAFAVLDGYPDGQVSSATYSLGPQLPAVKFDPIAKMHGSDVLYWPALPVDVTMSVPGYPNAQILYSYDTPPTASSALYSGPIHISTGYRLIKAMAIQSGFANGPVTAAGFGLIQGVLPGFVQIASQPSALNVIVGSDATLQVQATGDQPMSYQWQFNGLDLADGGNVSGSRSSSLHISAAQISNTGAYSVKIWNWANQVQSVTVLVTVGDPIPPTITEQPQNKEVALGESVTMGVSVNGTAPFTYQWFHNNTAIAGSSATERIYTIASAQTSDEGSYHVVVQNQAGTVPSSPDATLTVVPSGSVSVSIEATPGLNLTAGQSVTLNAVVPGDSSVSYQWQFDGKDLLGENASYLFIPDVELGNGDASYSVVVQNGAGNSAQASARLNVSADGTLQFSQINKLTIPAHNGTYVFSMNTLLPPNSDAENVRKFIITKVDSGTLLINGKSFSAQNNTIGPVDWVTWMPPIVADNPPNPAFTVYASDGTHDTSVTPGPLDVSIENKSKTQLFAWGVNTFGQVGNGYYGADVFDPDYFGGMEYQSLLNIIPKDPRWKKYAVNPYSVYVETSPQKVLDVPDVISVFGDDDYFVSAVAADGTVWQWGGVDSSFFLGEPYLYFDNQMDSGVDPLAIGGFIWRWGMPNPTDAGSMPLNLFSPTPRLYKAPRIDMAKEAFTGVSKIGGSWDSRIVLKTDGTLWSWGNVFDRNPKEGDDRYEDIYGRIHGISPRRVEIDGNDLTGVTDGRKFVDVEGNLVSTIALCKDGTVWWWPFYLSQDWPLDGVFDLWCDSATDYFPSSAQRHLTPIDNVANIDTPSAIIQIAASWQHYAVLRADGRVFEFGYVPQLDASGEVANNYYHAKQEKVVAAFSRQPVALNGLPTDTSGPNKVVAITLRDGFGVALTQGGQVWVWGHFGAYAGDGIYVPYQAPTQIDPNILSGIVKVAAGQDYILALDKRGLVWGWGTDYGSGVLGNSTPSTYLDGKAFNLSVIAKPTRIAGIEQVENIFSGYRNAFAVGVAEDPNRIVLAATPGDRQVMLSWHNCPSGATQYKVYRSTDRYDDNYALIATVDGTTFTDDNNGNHLVNGTAYYYKVAALVSGVETDTSWEQIATPRPLPEAIPIASILTNSECRGVQLTWSAPSNSADCQLNEYRILRSPSGIPGSFIALADVSSNTLQYFDNTVTSASYYQIIPVNDSGQPSSNSTVGPLTFDPTSCAAAPVIASSWRLKANDWFDQTSFDLDPNDPTAGKGYKTTLFWKAPDSGWTGTVNGFRIHYRYTSHGTPFGSTYTQDVTLEDAQRSNGGGRSDSLVGSAQYSFTWNTSGLDCYATVSAIVGGQEGEPSIEVGPASVDADTVQWSGILSATPGYQQVYVEWPDNENFCTYTILTTTTRPSRTPGESDAVSWTPLATVNAPRYWDTNLTDVIPTGAFSYSDIINATSLGSWLQNHPSDVLVAEIRQRWDSSQQSAFGSTPTDASVLANGLTEAVQWADVANSSHKKVLLSPSEFQTVNSQGNNLGHVFTPKTIELFDESDKLSDPQICVLNRLIIEEAYSSYGYGNGADWVGSMNAFRYYKVEGSLCGDIVSVPSQWVQARQDDAATTPDATLGLHIAASPYSGMVEVEWSLTKSFTGVVAGGAPLSLGFTSVQVISANRYNGASLIWQGVLGTDFNVDPVAGTVTIPTGSHLVCQSGDSVVISFAPLSADSQWQFWLERKLNTAGATYEWITEAGFGLAYLDQNVVNGQGYVYRVTAIDNKFNRWQAESSSVTPATSDSLSLSATAGNNYVDLAWPPLRATQFTIQHSLKSDSGFEVVASLTSADPYQNPPNTFRHTGVQNNVDHYYKVTALTPTGVQIDSPVVKVQPSSLLPLLPPSGFNATQVQDSSDRKFLLTWNAEEGASKYQVYLREGSSLNLIYEGSNPRCYYELPADIQAELQSKKLTSIDFRFAIRTVNLSGIAGDVNEKTVTWTDDAASQSATADDLPVHLKVGGRLLTTGTLLQFTGPTNLTLSVDLSIPNVQRVSYYDNGNLLGITEQGTTEFLWRHVPGGSHWLSATVEATDPNRAMGSTVATYSTPGPVTENSENVYVTIQPELSAFQTSITDLQLPAPGLPITLSRSYTSRSTTKDARGLAVGWSANWLAPSVALSSNLTTGWKGATTEFLSAITYYIFSDSGPHFISVNLPDGETAEFQPIIANNPETDPGYYENLDDRHIKMRLMGFDPAAGTLSGVSGVNIHTPSTLPSTPEQWAATSFTFGGTFGPYTYKAPDGTQYTFLQDAYTDGITNLPTEVKDRNGNTLTYTYDQGVDKKLMSIRHSSGRQVTFDYATANEIHVFDSMGGSSPVLKYVFDDLTTQNPKLLQVQHLVDRTGGRYETNTYAYGSAGSDQNRLTEIYDARNIRVVANSYTNSAGDLFSQTDAAKRTTSFVLDSVTNLTVTHTWTDENQVQHTRKAEVQHDASGAVSTVAQPTDDSGNMQTSSTLTYDDLGRLTVQTDADKNSKTFGYDSKNRLVSQTDENNNSTTIQPDDDHFGQPGIVEDALHHQTVYLYDEQGNPLDIKDPSGTETSYTYLDAVIGTGYSLGTRTRSERRDAPLVFFTTVTEYTYFGDSDGDGSGPMGDIKSTTEKWVQTTDKGGEQTIGTPITTFFEYDADGNRTAEVKSHTVNSGSPAMVEYVRTENTYDARNRITYTQIKSNATTSGSPPTQWTGVTTNYTFYNALGKQDYTVDGYDRTNYYVYDVSGNLIETRSPDNTVTRTTYDEQNRAVYVQDRTLPNGTVTVAPATKTTYDAAGRVTKVERLASITLTKSPTDSYVSNNITPAQFAMTASSAGSVLTTTRTFYDNVGREKFSVDIHNVTTENTYDAGGRKLNSKVYRGVVGPTYNYSGSGVPAPPANAAFIATAYTYDANGNQKTVTTGITSFGSDGSPNDGQTITYEYDAANRCTRTTFPVTGPSGSSAAYRATVYDGLGRRVQETDENHVATAFFYDFRGLLTSVTSAVGTPQQATTSYDYDELGNQIKQTDANNHTTTFGYDALGRRTSRTLPDNKTESVVYDNLLASPILPNKTVTDFNQHTTCVIFDNMDRVATNQLPAVGDFPATTVTYVYNSAGQRALVKQSGGVNRPVRYAYDALGRLRVKDTPEGTLTYNYNNDGSLAYFNSRATYTDWPANPPYQFENLTPDTDYSRPEWNYYYGGWGQLIEVADDDEDGWADYSYDQFGNLINTTYANGLITTYTYNDRNQLRRVHSVMNGVGLFANFDYDQAGEGTNATSPGTWADRLLSPTGQRRRAVEHYGSVQRTVDYDYDALQRLTRESITGEQTAVVAYDGTGTGAGYDAVGNRRSRQITSGSLSGVSSYTGDAFDSRDRLTRTGYIYDDNGNTTNNDAGAADYYDAENHLVKRTQSGHPDIVITYDADGNRVTKSVGGVTTSYLVDDRNPTGYAQVLEERDGNGATIRGYMYGLSLVSQYVYDTTSHDLASMYFYGYDGLGSVRYLTDFIDYSGNLTDTYTYDAFGIQIASTGTTANNHRYTGQQWDGDLGMYYLRARYYQPQSGRFWTMDSYSGNSEAPLSLHKYFYCQNNPINGRDLSGHDMTEMVVVTAIIFTLSTTTIEHQRPQSTPSFWDQINGGQSGFEEYSQEAYFENRWSGWLNRARGFYTDKLNVLVAQNLNANPGLTQIPWDNTPSSRIGVYPAGSNYGPGNDTKYGDAPESYWEKWSSLGAFTFEIRGPIRIDGNQWHADLVVGDVSLFNKDEPGHYILGSNEKHFIRARWDLSAQIGQ